MELATTTTLLHFVWDKPQALGCTGCAVPAAGIFSSEKAEENPDKTFASVTGKNQKAGNRKRNSRQMQVATRTLPLQDRGTAAASPRSRAQSQACELQSPAREEGSREAELRARLPTRLCQLAGPEQEIPPQPGFQQRLPQHPGNRDCFGQARFELFFKVNLDHQQGVPRLPRRRLLETPVSFKKKVLVVVGVENGI